MLPGCKPADDPRGLWIPDLWPPTSAGLRPRGQGHREGRRHPPSVSAQWPQHPSGSPAPGPRERCSPCPTGRCFLLPPASGPPSCPSLGHRGPLWSQHQDVTAPYMSPLWRCPLWRPARRVAESGKEGQWRVHVMELTVLSVERQSQRGRDCPWGSGRRNHSRCLRETPSPRQVPAAMTVPAYGLGAT